MIRNRIINNSEGFLHVCVCVHVSAGVRERERDRETDKKNMINHEVWFSIKREIQTNRKIDRKQRDREKEREKEREKNMQLGGSGPTLCFWQIAVEGLSLQQRGLQPLHGIQQGHGRGAT